MTRHPRRLVGAVAALCAVLALALTGCSDDGAGAGSGSNSGSNSGSSSS